MQIGFPALNVLIVWTSVRSNDEIVGSDSAKSSENVRPGFILVVAITALNTDNKPAFRNLRSSLIRPVNAIC